MGGRGASYGRSTIQSASQQTVTGAVPPDDNAVDDSIQMAAPPLGITQTELMGMSDDELHDFLIGVQSTDMPDFLPDGHLQHMIYSIGLNDKPEIVDQATLKRMVNGGAPAVYRTVNDTDVSGVKMTAKQVADDFTDGDLFVSGGGGGRAYGDGLYFSDSHRGSRSYGYNSNAYTIGGVLNNKARIVTSGQLRNEYDSWVKSHPKAQRALGFATAHGNGGMRTRSYAQFALLRGYNVIQNDVGGGEHYFVVLDRSAITTAKHNYTRSI